uniref:Exonuclease domain-containing protein n=2 Tax=Lotharella globosa TaxID=91324 RepID=A0A7S3Z1Y8_9EUKA
MIAFFDLETTVHRRKGDTPAVIEFGAILLDQKALYEKQVFSTLIKPRTGPNVAPITERSANINGITENMVQNSPTFADVADTIFRMLDGNIWAGHNIKGFDNPRITEEFRAIGRVPPRPSGMIDTYHLLKRSFGKARAGNLRLNTLGKHFGLGDERHRALADVGLNIEVLKSCATVIFLEKNFASMFSLGRPEGGEKESPAEAGDAEKGEGKASAPAAAKGTEQKSKQPEGTERKSKQPEGTEQKSKQPEGTEQKSKQPGVAEKTDAYAATSAIPMMSEKDKRKLLTAAMEQKKTVWIRYNGGTNPMQPRPIAPLGWKDHLVKATCKQSGSERHFREDRITEVISKVWSE